MSDRKLPMSYNILFWLGFGLLLGPVISSQAKKYWYVSVVGAVVILIALCIGESFVEKKIKGK